MHVMKQEETVEHVIGGLRRQVCKDRWVVLTNAGGNGVM